MLGWLLEGRPNCRRFRIEGSHRFKWRRTSDDGTEGSARSRLQAAAAGSGALSAWEADVGPRRSNRKWWRKRSRWWWNSAGGVTWCQTRRCSCRSCPAGSRSSRTIFLACSLTAAVVSSSGKIRRSGSPENNNVVIADSQGCHFVSPRKKLIFQFQIYCLENVVAKYSYFSFHVMKIFSCVDGSTLLQILIPLSAALPGRPSMGLY